MICAFMRVSAEKVAIFASSCFLTIKEKKKNIKRIWKVDRYCEKVTKLAPFAAYHMCLPELIHILFLTS